MKYFPLIFLFLALFAVSCSASTEIRKAQETNTLETVDGEPSVCVNKHCFRVQMAQTPLELARGLMYWKSLPEDMGMLFYLPEEEKDGFWMKNTLIPLDIIWLDKNRKIVTIAANVPPCESDPCQIYYPKEKALYVLEINGGLSQDLGIKEGHKVDFVFEVIDKS